MQIGSFQFVGDAYVGRLQTLTLDVPLRIVPIANPGPGKAPDWRVHLDDTIIGPEIGSAWTHEREGSGSCIAVQVDCPTFDRPLRASLVPSRTQKDTHVLIWSRQKRRGQEA